MMLIAVAEPHDKHEKLKKKKAGLYFEPAFLSIKPKNKNLKRNYTRIGRYPHNDNNTAYGDGFHWKGGRNGNIIDACS